MINHLNQVVTIWRATPDGLGGYIFAAPITANCRWEDNTVLLPTSNTEVSKATVYLDVDVNVEDYVQLGTHIALDPVSVGALQVRAFKKVPDLRTMNSLRKAWLI